ncbi:family 78 glycoside hydrolase catalytic domain [Metabacillus bambusae]|uniref:alpha-L-rhamnosidase n=1 Tax=Metabacillus bambusae TaxID=2795218 RepID=A0ABS3MZU2_9BACI|nr:family 78 glycoside hydrolase catalytic domain [Metabacillus bambusae]MBO1511532.1 family 78 glycoside hydrolase catalytic domain [Metabacillus bambusae]
MKTKILTQRPTGLLVELNENPLLVENLTNPSFSWIVNDYGKNEIQTAYQIIISEDDTFIDNQDQIIERNPMIWNSGKVYCNQSSGVKYSGPKLRKNTRYFWAVRTWNRDDQVSPFSKIEFFQTALKDNWKAVPIWQRSNGEISNPNWLFLRKKFKVQNKPIKYALAYATGQSPDPARQYVYRMNMNHQFVGLGPIRNFNDNCIYNAFDVTEHLHIGQENVIGTIAYTTENHLFMMELQITYIDGSTDVIITDETWKTKDAIDVYTDAGYFNYDYSFFEGPNEHIYVENFPYGFDGNPDFDDSSWHEAYRKEQPLNLYGYPSKNLSEVKLLPKHINEIDKNHFILDFGETIIGGLQLNIELDQKLQEPVDIKLGEVLNEDGHVKVKSKALVNYHDKWYLKQGYQEVRHWGYRGFRYAEIQGLPDFITISNIKGYVTSVALRFPFCSSAASFHSSNDKLNEIWSFSKNSIRVLNHNIYVDTPTREREPYEADSYLQQLSHYAVDREFSLARLSTEYLLFKSTWPMEWKIYTIMAAWQDYLHTGDDYFITKYYKSLKNKPPQVLLKGFDEEKGLVFKDSLNGYGENADIVDWPKELRDGYEYSNCHNVANAFYYKAMSELEKIANALGEVDDAKRFSTLAKKSREGIQTYFYDLEHNKFKDNIDGTLHYSVQSNAFVIEFGVASKEQANYAADYLASRGEIKGNVYSAPFLLASMFRNNQEQEAINFMTGHNSDGTKRKSINNWWHMIELGSGSTMEAWDESQDWTVSHSHPWGASPTFIVPREIFGIKPIKPAYELFEIKPLLNSLEYASITIPTIRGQINCSYNKTDFGYSFSVIIPVNTRGILYLTEGNEVKLNDDLYRPTDTDEGTLTYEIGSGSYEFSIVQGE